MFSIQTTVKEDKNGNVNEMSTRKPEEPAYHSLVGNSLSENSVKPPGLSQNWPKDQGASNAKHPHPSLEEGKPQGSP